jgi:hypothetical protein
VRGFGEEIVLEFSTLRKVKAEFWVSDFDQFGCDNSIGLRRNLRGVLLASHLSCV